MKADLLQYATAKNILAALVHVVLVAFIVLNLENLYIRAGVSELLADWILPASKEGASMGDASSQFHWQISVILYLLGGISYFWVQKAVPHIPGATRFLYSRIWPQVARRARMLEGMDKIRAFIDEAAKIRDETSHDPNEERAEWYGRVCPVLSQYYPQGLSGFQAQHTIHWQKRHREILDTEIMKLNGILVSMREAYNLI